MSQEERHHLATLAGEILQDTQKLVEQQVALVKLQIREDWGTAKPVLVAVSFALLGLFAVGSLIALAVVHLLHEKAGLPLWSAYLVTAGGFLISAILALLLARHKIKEMSLFHD